MIAQYTRQITSIIFGVPGLSFVLIQFCLTFFHDNKSCVLFIGKAMKKDMVQWHPLINCRER